ncbi:MAG: transposase [Ignavibacteriae bacterium]|nr:transposase [Ignavibacteriota bacterium]MCB9214704.1 transposase [Ignavibacteria bacterium]
MKCFQYILFALIFSLLSLQSIGCGEERAETTASWTPPELKGRPAGLDPGDYVLVKERVDGFRATLQQNPSDVKALVSLAQTFMYEARVSGDHPYYYPASEDLLDRALAIDPRNTEAVLSKASVLLSLHKFREALPIAQQAVGLAPNLAAAYGALVDANLELGNYAEAVKAADKMVAIRPDLKSYSRVSYLREIHGDEEGAIEAMQLAVAAGAPRSEEKAWARTTLGTLYLNQGKLKEARSEYTIASIERENYPFALAGIAKVQIAEGATDSAMALLDQAIALVPEFSFVEAQADIYRAAGNDRAADSLVAAIEKMLAEDEASGHNMDRELSLLWAKHGVRLGEAVERAERELARRPENIDAQDMVAYVLFRAGKAEQAKEYSLKARRMGTQSATMFAHAGMIEVALGNRGEGNSLLKRAWSLNPHLPKLLAEEIAETTDL